jgi:serine/threonine-protein kinase RsbT
MRAPDPLPEVLPIDSDADVVRVRQAVRELAVRAGLSVVDQTKLITAASELARNTLLHGGGGRAELALVRDGSRTGVHCVFADDGPGIVDLNRALQEGYTTGGGLGLGLPGSRRLADRFELESTPGVGTRVAIVKWGR